MIQASAVTVIKNAKTLLKDIHFQARPKELVAIVGANGAGKSTLLKVLAGLMTADVGTVSLNEQALPDYTRTERAQQIGYLSQQLTVSADFTAQEVVALGRYPYQQCAHRENIQRTTQALTMINMLDFATRRYQTLSGGEQQKIHLARVLAQIDVTAGNHSRFLLLDEHVAHLDIAHQHHTFQVLRSLLSYPIAIISVVHDLNLALRYADRVVVMYKGTVLAEGSPKAVLTAETIAHAFQLPVKIIHDQNEAWIVPLR